MGMWKRLELSGETEYLEAVPPDELDNQLLTPRRSWGVSVTRDSHKYNKYQGNTSIQCQGITGKKILRLFRIH